VPAIENLLKKTQKQVSDIDLFDINEDDSINLIEIYVFYSLLNDNNQING